MKLRTKIICIALVAAIVVGAAIGFAIYNRTGKTYDYAGKKMSKYLPMITDKDHVLSLYDGSAIHKTATDEDVKNAVAAKLASIGEVVTEGVIGEYDTVYYNYYMELDGEVITEASSMNPATSQSIQLDTNKTQAKIMDSLKGKDLSECSYNTFTTGRVIAGDKIVVNYSVGSESKEYQSFTVSGDHFLEEVKTGLTAKFLEKMNSTGGFAIGSATEFTIGEGEGAEKVSVTVKYAIRTTVVGGSVADGDTVYFQYREVVDGEAGTATPYYATLGTDDTKLDEAFGTGFATAVKGLTIGTESGEITATLSDETKTYKVKIEYATREDTTGVEEANLKRGEKFIHFTYTYAEDATDTAPKDKSVTLAGKTVDVYVAVTSMRDVNYDYETLRDDVKFEPKGDDELAKYVSAAFAYDKAQDAYDEATKEGSTKTDDEIAELKEALDDAHAAADEATMAYAKVLDGETLDKEAAAKKAFEEEAKKTAQDTNDTAYRYELAGKVWNALLTEAAAGVKFPSKAVRVSYNGLLDNLKTNYYGNRDTDPYSNYGSFKDYLKQYKYAGKDYKDELTAEAQSIVLQNLVLYRLVEIFDISLTETQEQMVSLYEMIYSQQNGVGDMVSTAYLFDNVMDTITELLDPALAD